MSEAVRIGADSVHCCVGGGAWSLAQRVLNRVHGSGCSVLLERYPSLPELCSAFKSRPNKLNLLVTQSTERAFLGVYYAQMLFFRARSCWRLPCNSHTTDLTPNKRSGRSKFGLSVWQVTRKAVNLVKLEL